MEILSRLENRIESILQRMRILEDENRRLKDQQSQALVELEAKNRSLQDELDRERASKEAVVARIDDLLKKLQDETM